MSQPNGASHNIRHTDRLTLDLGGNFVVEIFNVYLNVKPGDMPVTVRAYLFDNGNRMDMLSLDCPGPQTVDTVRQIACEALKTHRGLNRVLDMINRPLDKDI